MRLVNRWDRRGVRITAIPLWKDIMDDWSSVRLCDVANLFLSGVLFFSPWVFDLSSGAQWQTASVVGIIIGVLSIAALAAFAVWEEWFILIAGLALIVSPWLLGFQNSDAMTVDVIIGVGVYSAGCLRGLAYARSGAVDAGESLNRSAARFAQ